MVFRIGIALTAVITAAPSLSAQTIAGDSGAYFRTRCLSCHQPPDVNLAMDWAWLDQIQRTA